MGPARALIVSLFLIAGGLIVVRARNRLAVASSVHESLPFVGFGFVVQGLAVLSQANPGLMLVRIIGDGVALGLFVAAFVRAGKE